MPTPCLDPAACRVRQERLRARLRAQGLPAALLVNRQNVHYFTGYWHMSGNTAAAVSIPADGPVTLVAPAAPAAAAIDDFRPYEAARLCTLVDEQVKMMLAALPAPPAGRLGSDEAPGWLAPQAIDLNPALLALRRTKDADEVAMIRQAIACCNAAYATAKAMLRPWVTEVHLYAQMLAAASEAAGEPIGDFGNDFQSGTPGGLPRPRGVEEGEMAIFDLTAIYRGYCCDLCRSFVVGGKPSDAQREAYRLVSDALAYVEATVKPGTSCRALYHEVRGMLDGQHGWEFPHHLGHGVGLAPHEVPRLNPNWDDVFQAGDTFTAEPGLYGPELRGGIRIEHNYLVTATGVERLSPFPIEI